MKPILDTLKDIENPPVSLSQKKPFRDKEDKTNCFKDIQPLLSELDIFYTMM